jgi:hypothetical protein
VLQRISSILQESEELSAGYMIKVILNAFVGYLPADNGRWGLSRLLL